MCSSDLEVNARAREHSDQGRSCLLTCSALRRTYHDRLRDGIGDMFFLHQREQERALLVEAPERRARLWTSRVWPGAVLVDGEIAGTWRRAGAAVTVEPWRAFTSAERQAVEAEAASLPLPGVEGDVTVQWQSHQQDGSEAAAGGRPCP